MPPPGKKSHSKKSGSQETNAGKTAPKNGNAFPGQLDYSDFANLTQALMKAAEDSKPLLERFFAENDFGDLSSSHFDPYNIQEAYMTFLHSMMTHPQQFIDMQIGFWDSWIKLWQNTLDRFVEGEEIPPLYSPKKGDRRFRDDIWRESALFDFIKQSYLLTSDSIMKAIYDMDDLDPHEKEKLEFHARQLVNAIAPNNFILTNPEVIEATINTGGENLVKGLKNLLEDLGRGKGRLDIRKTDYTAFKVGKNIAVTPGKVVYENDLMQLIQYEPQTQQVFKRPLLIIPPWINKYYILDLRPENSFIDWLVKQGHTVFTISWVNPDEDLAEKNFEDYMTEGCLEAMNVVRSITGEQDCNVIGYCLGGTLLASVLAWFAAGRRKKRIASATFLTTLIDFEKAGDLRVFIDDEQISLMEKKMARKGYLDATTIKNTFSMLRSSDLIWSFVVNNYLLGKEPFPFDLLYWNDDATNMPAKMHSFYLRKMYHDNLLAKPGGLTLCGEKIDITKIKTPSYFLSSKQDHIAPWPATYAGARLFSGPVHYTLSASGHIAGVVNPPAAKKYCYYKNDEFSQTPEQWLANAKEYDGSWWPDWQKWIKKYTGPKVKARKPGNKDYPPIEDAPGRYVKVKYDAT